MSTAHQDNDGIQVFSATQTAEQIEKALSGQGYGEFESTTYSRAPITPEPTAEPVVDPAAPPAVDPNAPKPPARPGKHERQLAKARKEAEQLRSEVEKTRLEMAELRGMITGRQSATPAAEPVVAPEPKTEPVAEPVIEVPQFDKARPTRDQFFDAADPDTAYEDAVANWTIDRREFEKTAAVTVETKKQDIKRQQDTQKSVGDRWNAALSEAKQEYKDFDEVMSRQHFDAEKKPLPVISDPMSHIARTRKLGAKILYYLGTHPEEANKIAVKTTIADPSDPWAVEDAMSEVRREFDRIEQELAKAPPQPEGKPAKGEPAAVAVEPVEDDDDDLDDEDEPEVDPNLPVVADPVAGRQVSQGTAPGAVDTKPAAPVAAPKSEPVSRVGNRQTHVNRATLATPPEVLRNMTPEEFRRKRALEGSPAARG